MLAAGLIVAAVWVVVCLVRASRSRRLLLLLLPWALVQALLAHGGFYEADVGFPPRLLFMPGPPFLALLLLSFLAAGRRWLDGLALRSLTWVHAARVPVELVLWGLFLDGTVPELMTFTGGNPDILAGLSAPLAAHLTRAAHQRGRRRWLLAWNVVSLLLLLNIVTRGLLSGPSPFQRFGLEIPDFALTHVPYVWLPSLIVPIVLLSHVSAIRQLIRTKQGERSWVDGAADLSATAARPIRARE